MSAANPYSVNLSACPQYAGTGARRRGRWLTSTALGAAGLVVLANASAAAQGLPVYDSQKPLPTGVSSIDTAANSVTVNQTASKAVINWDSFNVGANNSVVFNQPSTSAITLNRDMSGQLSRIDGDITANGQVWILNPKGVLIGAGGSITAQGFLGTTHAIDIDDDAFVAGDPYGFTDNADNLGYGYGFAEVVNEGVITANSGYAILAGHEVRNTGRIVADLGQVVLAGAQTFTVALDGDRLISFAVGSEFTTLSNGSPLVRNDGFLGAAGGKVIITSRAANAIIGSVVNVGGTIDASNVARDADGNITLTAPGSGTIQVDGGINGLTEISGKLIVDNSLLGVAGTIQVAGGRLSLMGEASLLAEAPAAGGVGGRIEIVGKEISINSSRTDIPTISATGKAGGGVVAIGGGSAASTIGGRNLAEHVFVGSNSRIYADSITSGNGGTVTIWANPNSTTGEPNVAISGQVFARSGLASGGGGTIEVGGTSIEVFGAAALNAVGTDVGGKLRVIGDEINIQTYEPNSESSVPQPGLYAWAYDGTGGSIKIGGDVGGLELVKGRAVASEVSIGQGTEINAGAIENGNGGTITIWSGGTGKTSIDGAFIWAGGDEDDGQGGAIHIGGYDVELGYADGYESGYGTYIDASGGYFGSEGEGFSKGGSIDVIAANNIRVGEEASLYANGLTEGGRINLAAGKSILLDGQLDARLCCSFIPASTSGPETTGTGSINLSAGEYVRTRAAAIYGDGIVSITAGKGISLEHRNFFEEYDEPTLIFSHNITLTADALSISQMPFDEPGAEVFGTSSVTVQPLTASRNIRAGGLPDPAPMTPSIDSEFVPAGADFAAGSATLVLDELELDAFEAPTVTLGRVDGTGTVDIYFSPDGDEEPDDSCDGLCDIDGPSITIVQAGGAGGSITLHGKETIDERETYRFIAGSNVTLADDLGMEVNGKLELVSGGSFTNLAGASALTTTPGEGQWLIYSADPSLDMFGGLVSGQTALWGRSFSDVAANGIAHTGNRYAFGLSPTLTISATGKSKTYGEALDLSTAVLGRDYQVAGLIDAATYGNVFNQDSFSGSVMLASSGAAAGANAGSYAITVSGGSGFAAPAGYSISFLSSTLTVNRRLLSASLANASKVYDGTTTAALGAANYSLSGVVSGDEAAVAIAGANGNYDNKNAGTGKTVTVSGLTLTGAKASNYELSSTTLSGAVGTITPKTLTASLVGTTSKTYDATTTATLSAANYSLAGFVDGEGGSVSATAGTYSSPNVGSNLAVSATLAAGNFNANTGTSLSNYQLPTTASGAIGSITPATLTYVANSASRDRGTANPALTGSVTGFVGNETQGTATTGTLAFTTTATATSPAGNYAINGGGLTAGNYVFVQSPGNATALRVNEGAAPVQQVTTTVVQQVSTSTRTPPPPPPGPLQTQPNPVGGLNGVNSGPAGGNLANNTPPPPPPPPLAAPTGGNPPPPPAGPAVESTPPSPVGDAPPETPADTADQGDTVLAEAETEDQQGEASSEKRQLANTTTVAPGIDVEVPAPPRSTDVPGAEQSFSGSGNPAQW